MLHLEIKGSNTVLERLIYDIGSLITKFSSNILSRDALNSRRNGTKSCIFLHP
jgi:hypothetical protein